MAHPFTDQDKLFLANMRAAVAVKKAEEAAKTIDTKDKMAKLAENAAWISYLWGIGYGIAAAWFWRQSSDVANREYGELLHGDLGLFFTYLFFSLFFLLAYMLGRHYRNRVYWRPPATGKWERTWWVGPRRPSSLDMERWLDERQAEEAAWIKRDKDALQRERLAAECESTKVGK